jgi:hypothetical protein
MLTVENTLEIEVEGMKENGWGGEFMYDIFDTL